MHGRCAGESSLRARLNRSNAYLAGSANIVSTNRGTCKLVKQGDAWYEICRDLTNG